MTAWFTADHHFGHEKIIAYMERPFSSVEEMDEEMIARWNAVVAPGDMVFHLGDFAWRDPDRYLAKLNGQKRLVRGNHDSRKMLRKTDGWATVNDLLSVTVEGQRIVLCHYGLRVWPGSHKGALHFYGHSHGTLEGDSQSIDVGVDCWGFTPVALNQICARLSKQPARHEPDYHASELGRMTCSTRTVSTASPPGRPAGSGPATDNG